MTVENLEDLSKAGVVLALVGGLLAIVPNLETLIALDGGWPNALLMGLLAAGVLAGAWLALRDRRAIGSLAMVVGGMVLAVLGPTAAGVIALVGGVLVYADLTEPGPSPYQAEPSQRDGGSMGSGEA